MKLNPILSLLALTLVGGPVLAFTHESPHEFYLDADLDGDGRQDVVIVDRATGAFRVGYQLAAGLHSYSPARAGGIHDVSAASAGRLLGLGRDTLVLTSPSANRANLIEAPTADSVVTPVSVYPPGIGPSEACAIDIGGGGNTAHADLVTVSVWNDPPSVFRRGLVRWNGAAASLIWETVLGSEWSGLQSVRLLDGGPIRLGSLEVTGGDYRLQVLSLLSGAPVVVTSATGMGSRYVHGRFTAGPLHHYLSYTPGGSNLISRPVTETVTGTFNFGAASQFNMGRPLSQVVVLESAPTHRLLCLFHEGAEAAIYTFDGSAAPVLSATLPVPAGQVINGALALGNGDVHLLGGAPGQPSSRFTQYGQSGANYVQKATGGLPDPNPLGTPANVFLFAEEPFVSSNPRLLRSLNAADWASKPDLSGANVVVSAERRGSAAQGLGNAVARNLGRKPAGAAHAMVNQFRDSISVTTFLPAIGDEGGEVSIQPPPGPQTQAVEVVLTPGPGAFVVYRTGAGQSWSSSPGPVTIGIFHTTTIEYHARVGGSSRSRIRQATYTFPGLAQEQDSDGDGVPDFVEIGKGLNPNGGNDSDGDGFTDKNELFAGTDPRNTNSVPAVKLEEWVSFNLVVSPKAVYLAEGPEISPRLGQGVSLHDLTGSLLARRVTTNTADPQVNPAVVFLGAPANTELGLLTMATDPHFEVTGAVPTPGVGRELLGLFPVPRVETPAFEFTPGPGDLISQADAWIAQAKASLGSLPTPSYRTRLTHLDTMLAVLLERKLQEIFLARGLPGLAETNPITLFPHRPNDVLRTVLTATDVESLRQFGPGGLPAWNLVSLHRALRFAVTNTSVGHFAREIYSISARSNNVAPGRYPLPVEVLREFVVTGQLHSNYLAATVLNPGQLTAAKTEIDTILSELKPRPVVIHDLAVTPGTFDGECRALVTVPGGTIRNLFTAPGVPFKFPATFDLVPGSMVRVRGFSDLEEECAGDDLEVLSAELISVPAVELVDADGDLMPDAWECVFLGGDGDPYGDLDGDGISNLQEYLDGTDPADSFYKVLAFVDLSPPAIDIVLQGQGGVHKLGWSFPAMYAGRFNFALFQANELGIGFVPAPVGPIRLPNGGFEVELPGAEGDSRFYIIVQSLK